jgi:DNA-binding NtrC family response regulator
LVAAFLKRYAVDFGFEAPVITPDALALLQSDPWPGNIRELENVTRRLLLDARGLAIDAAAVRRALAERANFTSVAGSTLTGLVASLLERARRGEINDVHARLIAEAEREIFSQAITLSNGNLSQATRWLGISRLTLREKLAALGLRAPSLPPGES